MKAMIFAAGLGTRLRPLTDTMPKAMVPIGGKPLIRHIVDKLKLAGYGDIVINVHHFADQVEEYFRTNADPDIRVNFSDERDLLRDTGGGLLHARGLLEGCGRFLLHNVDIISNLDLRPDTFAVPLVADPATFSAPLVATPTIIAAETVSHHQPAAPVAASVSPLVATPTIIAAETVSPHQPAAPVAASASPLATIVVSPRKTSRYLLFDPEMHLVGWENVTTGEVRSPFLSGGSAKAGSAEALACPRLQGVTPFAFAGIHYMSDGIFPILQEYAAKNDVEVFSIIDFYLSACEDHCIRGLVPEGFRMVDVGKTGSLAAAQAALSNH